MRWDKQEMKVCRAVGHFTGEPEEKKEQALGTPKGKDSPGRGE